MHRAHREVLGQTLRCDNNDNNIVLDHHSCTSCYNAKRVSKSGSAIQRSTWPK